LIEVDDFHLGLLPNELVESMKALYCYEAKHDPADTGSVAIGAIEPGEQSQNGFEAETATQFKKKTA